MSIAAASFTTRHMKLVYQLKFLVLFALNIFLNPVALVAIENQEKKKISRAMITQWEKQIEKFDLSVADSFGLPICPLANGKTGFIWGDAFVSLAAGGIELTRIKTREMIIQTGPLFWNEEKSIWVSAAGTVLLGDDSGQCRNTWRVPAQWEVTPELGNPAYRGAYLQMIGRYKGFKLKDCKKVPGSEHDMLVSMVRNVVTAEMKDAADEGIRAWRDKTRIIDKELTEAKSHLRSIKRSADKIASFVSLNQFSNDTNMKARVAEAKSNLNSFEADIKNFEESIKGGEAAIKTVEDIFRDARRLSIFGGKYKDHEVPKLKPLDQVNSVVLAMISQSWAEVHAADTDLIPAVKRFKEMLKNVDAVGKERVKKFED